MRKDRRQEIIEAIVEAIGEEIVEGKKCKGDSTQSDKGRRECMLRGTHGKVAG